MLSPAAEDVTQRAKAIYELRLKAQLEPTHRGWFLVIEPDSGDYYLGRSIEEASRAARQVHPDKLCHCLRIGFRAAVEFGASSL